MEQNNFWNTCERQLDRLPSSICSQSQCQWYINSKKDNNCFWKYIKRNSKVDGSMEPISDANICKLLSISKGELSSELEKATKKLHNILKNLGFREELSEEESMANKVSPTKLTIISDD